MLAYILRRFALLVPVLFGVSIVVFTLIRLIPGDPASIAIGVDRRLSEEQRENVRKSYGLDQPLPVQYAKWMGHIVRGDLGNSLRTRRPLSEELKLRLPVTLQLATLLVLCFSFWLKWLPPIGFKKFTVDPVQNIKTMIMPAIALGLPLAAVIMRNTRSAVLEVLSQDYVRVARAKGLASNAVLTRHVLRNASIPIIT